MYHFGRFDTAETFIQPVVIEDETPVVEAEAVQQGGVEIVYTDSIFDGVITKIIGCAIGSATFDAASREPDRKPIRTMVAARFFRLLGKWQATKLTTPYQ